MWWLAAHEGDYWRLLTSGRYTVTACADVQYDCVSKAVVVDNRPHTQAQIIDFTLPLAAGSHQQASFLTPTVNTASSLVFLMAGYQLGFKLVRLGWSMKNSLVVLLVQLLVVNTQDLIP